MDYIWPKGRVVPKFLRARMQDMKKGFPRQTGGVLRAISRQVWKGIQRREAGRWGGKQEL